MKDDPRALLKLCRRTKVLTLAPILAVGWKYFDRVILNSQLFVNCWAKDFLSDARIYDPDGTFRGIFHFTQQTSVTEFG